MSGEGKGEGRNMQFGKPGGHCMNIHRPAGPVTSNQQHWPRGLLPFAPAYSLHAVEIAAAVTNHKGKMKRDFGERRKRRKWEREERKKGQLAENRKSKNNKLKQ